MKLRPIYSLPKLSLIFIILITALAPVSGVSAQPAASSPTATGCQWTYYPVSGNKLQPQVMLYNDPDNTPENSLSLGNPFKGKSAKLATTGSADFNGDNKTDVFRIIPRGDSLNYQWQYSSGGAAPWQNLAYATTNLPTTVLQFGEFNSDTKTDIFANLYNSSLPGYQWLESPGGTGGFVNLSSTPNSPNRLAMGDFNGDGLTDVFTAVQNGSNYQWAYSSGGTGPRLNLAFAGTDPALLRFGDFNGDGKTDVFAANQLPDGSYQWVYSSGGAASFTNLNTSTVPYSELYFGDFDGDGKTDVLTALPQSDGSLLAVYYPGGLGPAVTLGKIPAPAPALRVGDFNGDGISDLMALGCGMGKPLAFSSLQTVAPAGYATFNQIHQGDVNGDGLPDLILVSTCQNPDSIGTCVSHHLQVGAALGTKIHTYTLIPPQTLSQAAIDFTYYKILTGDFNGDGKTDIALINQSGTTLTIYMALSNGNGTFTLNGPQVFTGEQWGNFNPTVGDFNGDGKADLSFTTVCAISSGSCSEGVNNSLYVATAGAGGAFSMSARQDFSQTGWDYFITLAGDFNGDGKTDLLFNATCKKVVFTDPTCTVGDANEVYTALSNGNGSFTLSAKQTYGATGWTDYNNFLDVAGDINGDGRTDLVWASGYQAGPKTSNNLVVVGTANPDGTFQIGSVQDFGSAWSGRLALTDLNHDGKADLLWNNAPLSNIVDVDTYAVALSTGNGAFNILGPGEVFTGSGYFQIPNTNYFGKVPNSLTLLSTRQNSISNAFFVVEGVTPDVFPPNGFPGAIFLPVITK